MIANHIHDSLAQVRQLRGHILSRRNFRGYSGFARMGGGVVALLGAVVLSTIAAPATNSESLIGWSVVLFVGLSLNYGALACWFFFSPDAKRDLVNLAPAIDAVPALAVGAIASVALVTRQRYDLLYGMWMSCYGLAHMSYRQSLPRSNYMVGVFYIVCGSVCFLVPTISFLNPWPMALVFFFGEMAGGYVFWRLNGEGRYGQE